jgi:hypothetical protein
MPVSRPICSCDAVLTEDERKHYVYQCSRCAVTEHDLIRAYQRGEDHPDIEALFKGPVLIGELEPRRIRRRAA